MKKLFFLALLCTSFAAFARTNPKVDSLQHFIAKLPPKGKSFASDTTRIKVLCQLALMYMENDTSITYFKEALGLATQIKWDNGQALVLNHYGRKIKKKEGDQWKAGTMFYQALFFAEKAKDLGQMAFSYRNIGDTYSNLDRLDSAYRFYHKALPLYKKLNDKEGILTVYNNIGLTLIKEKKLNLAVNHFKICLGLNQGFKIKKFDGIASNNLGYSYQLLCCYDSAMYFAQNALTIHRTLPNSKENQATALVVLSSIYREQHKYPEALRYAKAAANVNGHVSWINDTDVLRVLFKSHKAMGHTKEALFYYEKYVNKTDSLNKERVGERQKAMTMEYTNQVKEAKIKLMAEEAKVKDEEAKRKNTMLIGLGIGLLLFLVLVSTLIRNNRLLTTKNAQIEAQQSEILKVQKELQQTNEDLNELNRTLDHKVEERTTELQQALEEVKGAMLKGQTLERKRVASELHDNLGANLSALKWQFESLGPQNLTESEYKIYKNILDTMQKVHTDVRLISHNLLPAELEEKGLIAALEKLTNDINRLGRLQISLNTGPNIQIADKKAEFELYSICLELTNNILKHADATEVYVNFRQKDNILSLSVMDNGKGMNVNEEKEGMGLKNIRNRVGVLNGQFTIESEPNEGTKFSIKIPTDVL